MSARGGRSMRLAAVAEQAEARREMGALGFGDADVQDELDRIALRWLRARVRQLVRELRHPDTDALRRQLRLEGWHLEPQAFVRTLNSTPGLVWDGPLDRGHWLLVPASQGAW